MLKVCPFSCFHVKVCPLGVLIQILLILIPFVISRNVVLESYRFYFFIQGSFSPTQLCKFM